MAANVTLEIVLVGGNIEFRSGGTPVTGDVYVHRGNLIKFTSARPFAIFIKGFAARPRRPAALRVKAGKESPIEGQGIVFASDIHGEAKLKIRQLARLGTYWYGVAVLGTSGRIATLDPRIIIE